MDLVKATGVFVVRASVFLAEVKYFAISLQSKENNNLYLRLKIFCLELIITVVGDKFVTEVTEIKLNILKVLTSLKSPF